MIDTRKWEELSPAEQEDWNKVAEEAGYIYLFLDRMSKINRCWMCKKWKGDLMVKNPGRELKSFGESISRPFMVHMKTTHGIHPEILFDMLNTILKEVKEEYNKMRDNRNPTVPS